MDFVLARTNMVKSQIAPNSVTDTNLLDSLLTVEREAFVDVGFRDFAYSDLPIPCQGTERRMLKPLQVARMIQALEVVANNRVLVIGAGSGYEAAILAKMGCRVFAQESNPDLAAIGQRLLPPEQVQWRVGDVNLGWPEVSPFDGILLCGSVVSVPNRPIGQLGRSGRLVAVVGKPGGIIMRVVRMIGISGGDRPEVLFETVATPLSGVTVIERFEL